MPTSLRPALACSLLLLAVATTPARAAESFDSCTATINVLPKTLSTQGTWCLRGDLATSMAAGAAITVTTNNVTIDCNGFKLGGLGAGPATAATGILAVGRANVTVRNCNLRGFSVAIDLQGNGATVAANRFEGNLDSAIHVNGTGAVVRGNVVVDTGAGENTATTAIELLGSGDVIANIVQTVIATDSTAGIHAAGEVTVADNRIRGVAATPVSTYGIVVGSTGAALVHGNNIVVVGSVGDFGRAIFCDGNVHSAVRDNTVFGTITGIVGCPHQLDNKSLP